MSVKIKQFIDDATGDQVAGRTPEKAVYDTNGTRLDDKILTLATKTELAAKADKTYVDTQLAGKASTSSVGEISSEISTLSTAQGNLSDLTTTAKSSLVAAINEAAQSGGGGEKQWKVVFDGVVPAGIGPLNYLVFDTFADNTPLLANDVKMYFVFKAKSSATITGYIKMNIDDDPQTAFGTIYYGTNANATETNKYYQKVELYASPVDYARLECTNNIRLMTIASTGYNVVNYGFKPASGNNFIILNDIHSIRLEPNAVTEYPFDLRIIAR